MLITNSSTAADSARMAEAEPWSARCRRRSPPGAPRDVGDQQDDHRQQHVVGARCVPDHGQTHERHQEREQRVVAHILLAQLVGQHAAQPGAERPAEPGPQAERQAHEPQRRLAGRRRHAEVAGQHRQLGCVVAQEEGCEELPMGVADERGERAAHGEQPERRPRLERREHQGQRQVVLRVMLGAGGLGQLAARLAQRQDRDHREDQAGQARHHEGRPPAVVLGHDPADRHAQQGADRNTHGIDRQRGRPFLRREIVGEQRVRGRRTTRFADAHPGARDRQDAVAFREGAEHREPAPHRQRQGHHQRPVRLVRHPRDRDA